MAVGLFVFISVIHRKRHLRRGVGPRVTQLVLSRSPQGSAWPSFRDFDELPGREKRPNVSLPFVRDGASPLGAALDKVWRRHWSSRRGGGAAGIQWAEARLLPSPQRSTGEGPSPNRE